MIFTPNTDYPELVEGLPFSSCRARPQEQERPFDKLREIGFWGGRVMLAGGVRPVMAHTIPDNSVTLNLFQGPSGRKRGASWIETQLTGMLANARSGGGEEWALKKVQGGDFLLKQTGGQIQPKRARRRGLFGELIL